MPIIKHISIHKSPLSMLEYIMNGDKNSDMKYASGINCEADVISAYSAFKYTFERCSRDNFFKYTSNESKDRIRIHHYIQSFSPEEKISPEEAHRIGLEWAKKVFGSDRQIICSTHIDKNHIHNHFAVAPYSLNRVIWHDNMKTLIKCRKISDEIALKHGLSIIENPEFKSGRKYKEWQEERTDSSWKGRLRTDIDSIIADSSTISVDDIIKKLSEKNYSVKSGKYISIRASGQERSIRSFRLGSGYSLEDLEFRLQNKDKEYSLDAIMNRYKGIQTEYALVLRKIQITVYHKQPNPKKYNYKTLRTSADMLSYLYQNNFHSLDDFKKSVVNISEKTNTLATKKSKFIKWTYIFFKYY